VPAIHQNVIEIIRRMASTAITSFRIGKAAMPDGQRGSQHRKRGATRRRLWARASRRRCAPAN
jgi:hypothetical protein